MGAGVQVVVDVPSSSDGALSVFVLDEVSASPTGCGVEYVLDIEPIASVPSSATAMT